MSRKETISSESIEGTLQLAILEALRTSVYSETESHQIDVVRIPQQQDKMVRIRTIEEIIEDFESDATGESVGYLVQIKKHPIVQTEPTPPFSEPSVKQMPDGVYLHDGKLNLQYLLKNAEILFSAGEYSLSRNIYQTIRQSGEKTATALQGIASCYEAEGRLDQAATHYEESIAYHATLESYQRLASILIRKNKGEEAAETYERALQLREASPETRSELHNACGNCWARSGKLQNAESHYLKALDLNPNSSDFLSNLGAAYLQGGRIKEAKRRFEDSLVSNPNQDKALSGLGSCYLVENDRRLAHDYFAKSLDVQLNNSTAIYYLVKCAFEIKTYATAARILEEYVRIAPVNSALLYSLAALQYHVGRYLEAALTARQILGMNPTHSGAKEILSMASQESSLSN